MDPQLGEFTRADVLIEDEKIVAVGVDIEVEDAELIDAQNCIVMPGFVDAHRHIWQGAMRGVCADWSLLDYVAGIRMNAASAYTADDMYAAQYHGTLEAMNAGVTTVTDYCHNLNSPDHVHESIRGVAESGMRVIWNYGFNRPPLENPAFKTLDERVQFARDIAVQYFSDSSGLLSLGIAPEEPGFWPSPEAGDKQFNLARELDARVFWHCNSAVLMGERTRDVARIHQRGLLGPDVVLVHAHYTDPDEWQMVADSGASVAFTPDTELQMGMLWPSADIARRMGITQSYGTDITSNNSADMFTALRVGLQATRCKLIDEASGEQLVSGVPFTCADALAWGTIDGARALGLDHLVGSLTPGKQADIVLLRTDTLTMVGWDRTNVAGTILLQSQASDVDTVMVAGRVVKRDGRMLADTAHACRLLQAAHERVTTRVAKLGGYRPTEEESLNRIAAVASSEDGKYQFR
jgi:cytosine/adenosine deaminase-related metal-dependent hydrolase